MNDYYRWIITAVLIIYLILTFRISYVNYRSEKYRVFSVVYFCASILIISGAIFTFWYF